MDQAEQKMKVLGIMAARMEQKLGTPISPDLMAFAIMGMEERFIEEVAAEAEQKRRANKVMNVQQNPTHSNKIAADQPLFRRACSLAGIEPTTRQAAKFHAGTGKAFQFKAQADLNK